MSQLKKTANLSTALRDFSGDATFAVYSKRTHEQQAHVHAPHISLETPTYIARACTTTAQVKVFTMTIHRLIHRAMVAWATPTVQPSFCESECEVLAMLNH